MPSTPSKTPYHTTNTLSCSKYHTMRQTQHTAEGTAHNTQDRTQHTPCQKTPCQPLAHLQLCRGCPPTPPFPLKALSVRTHRMTRALPTRPGPPPNPTEVPGRVRRVPPTAPSSDLLPPLPSPPLSLAPGTQMAPGPAALAVPTPSWAVRAADGRAQLHGSGSLPDTPPPAHRPPAARPLDRALRLPMAPRPAGWLSPLREQPRTALRRTPGRAVACGDRRWGRAAAGALPGTGSPGEAEDAAFCPLPVPVLPRPWASPCRWVWLAAICHGAVPVSGRWWPLMAPPAVGGVSWWLRPVLARPIRGWDPGWGPAPWAPHSSAASTAPTVSHRQWVQGSRYYRMQTAQHRECNREQTRQ